MVVSVFFILPAVFFFLHVHKYLKYSSNQVLVTGHETAIHVTYSDILYFLMLCKNFISSLLLSDMGAYIIIITILDGSSLNFPIRTLTVTSIPKHFLLSLFHISSIHLSFFFHSACLQKQIFIKKQKSFM